MGTVCQSFITATATLFLFLTSVHLQEVKTSGIFELNLVAFEQREGRVYLGSGCCSGRPGADGYCPPCPVYLRICVKHYQVNVTTSPCTFHEFNTPLLQPLEEGKGLEVLGNQQETMAFDLNFTWPEQFSLIVEAWHSSEKNSDSKVLVDRLIGQKTLKVGLDWTEDTMSSNKSTLKLMYRVYCINNYYGPDCNDLCKPRNDKFGHYTCKEDGMKMCIPGWTGNYCDKPICLPGCHKEYGTCDLPNECKCRHGWEGPFCDTCIRYPGCIHGTCDQPYQCICDEGWGGLSCDQDLNYCTNHKPCKNGGTCTNTGQGYYTCSCTDEFMGNKCEIPRNPCLKNPCKNGGFCENFSAGKYTCKCSPGFFGPHCETTANTCQKNPCENGGSCVYDVTGFTCDCLPGFTGVLCENREPSNCRQDYCLNGGTCVELPHGLQCNCSLGFSGDRCETLVTCSLNVCKNGGTCRRHPSTGQLSCTCPPSFSGWNCEEQLQKCASNPCANSGECRELPDGYSCDCKSGYTGKDCSIKHSRYCNPNSCLNGAFCNETVDGFSCICLRGYRGVRCQYKDNNSSIDFKRQSSLASNVSHRVSSEEESQSLSGKQIALIASLSSVLPICIIVLCCVLCCTFRRRKLQQAVDVSAKTKDCNFDVEEEQLQNERNIMQMNNKQCNMPQKIVNTLDRLPTKVSNEAPPKVLNIEVSNKKVLDKSLMYTQRTLQKRDNTCGSSFSSHIPPDWPSSKNTGIYVIEDHFRSCPETKPTLEVENVLATEV